MSQNSFYFQLGWQQSIKKLIFLRVSWKWIESRGIVPKIDFCLFIFLAHFYSVELIDSSEIFLTCNCGIINRRTEIPQRTMMKYYNVVMVLLATLLSVCNFGRPQLCKLLLCHAQKYTGLAFSTLHCMYLTTLQ